jgi:hypothetical protein
MEITAMGEHTLETGRGNAPGQASGRFRWLPAISLTLTSFLYGWPLPLGTASADFQFKVGSFTKTTAVAPPDQSQSVTGLGFQPKVLIFFPMRQTSAGPAWP